MKPTAIDFFSGSHGHFLEYCINRYIYQIPSFADQLLTATGTSHGLKGNSEYLSKRQAVSGHYTEFNSPVVADNIVRIVISDFMGACCYQLNVINRAGDVTADEKNQQLPDSVLNSPSQLRNYYYSKFTGDGYQLPSNWQRPGFDFEMSSLYRFDCFLHEMKNTADYLNLTFTPDRELGILWKQFLEKNHGLQAWQRCQNAVEQIFCNDSSRLDFDIQHQALLNCLLSRAVGIHDGALFDQDQYPGTTKEIYHHIQKHIDTFDSRFV